MKKMKLVVFLAAFAVYVMFPLGVDAAKYGICLSGVEYQKDTDTGKVKKTEWGNQSVRIDNAFTSLTNPCPECAFRVKPYNVDTGVLGGVVVKKGEKKEFINHDGAGAPGTYYLKVARFDFTLLQSTVALSWFYQ